MGRGTLGTGMMAPLAMANNFNGPYYAGPSGAAMGALMAAQSIGEGLRDWGASKGRQQDEARVQEERDRVRMDELNQRLAVASAINPMQGAQSSGMGNRDMSRRMALPDASTQMGIYGLQQKQQDKSDAELMGKRKNLATSYLVHGGKDIAGFIEKFKFDPYEYADPNTITRVEENALNRESREQMAREARENTRLISEATRANKDRDGAAKLSDVNTTRTAFMRDSGNFINQRDGFTRVVNGAMEAEKSKDTGVGDIKIIFGYMKLLDPTSVVREGEFATAQNSSGIPERVRVQYNNILKGDRLGENARKEFVQSAYNEYSSAKKNHESISGTYKSLANRYGVPVDDIMPDLYSEADSRWESFNKPKLINPNTQPPTNGRPPLDSFGSK